MPRQWELATSKKLHTAKKKKGVSQKKPFTHERTHRASFTASFTLRKNLLHAKPPQPARTLAGSRHLLCFLSSFTRNLHHRHTDRRSRTISKKKSSPELGNKPEPPWATIQRFVFHDFPFSPIWISNWVFGFFVCFIGNFQILSISFLMRTEGECLFISFIVLMKDDVLGFDMIWGLFGFWIRDVWLIWLS